MSGGTINAEEKSTINNSSLFSKVKKFNGTISLQYQANYTPPKWNKTTYGVILCHANTSQAWGGGLEKQVSTAPIWCSEEQHNFRTAGQ